MEGGGWYESVYGIPYTVVRHHCIENTSHELQTFSTKETLARIQHTEMEVLERIPASGILRRGIGLEREGL